MILVGCSIEMETPEGIVEDMEISQQASAGGIRCIASGVYPHVSNLASTQVAVNINSYFDEYAYHINEDIRSCPEQLADLTVENTELLDATDVDYEVTRFDETYFSVVLLRSQYFEDAAHPNNFIDTFVFNLSSGQPMELQDFFQNDVDAEIVLMRYVIEQAEEHELEYPSESSNPIAKFYVTEDEIVLVDLYSVHAAQAFEVHVPFRDLKDTLKEGV